MLTTREAAKRLGVTPRQVRRYVAEGLLAAQPLGDYSTAPLAIDEESLARLEQERASNPQRRRRDPAGRSGG